MIKGIYTAGRSLEHRTKNIDVVANNLANLSTTGFKREIPFSEIINQFGEVDTQKLTSQQQGEIIQTSNQLDLAISGNGFFAVKNEEGAIELTRDGRFKISDEGFLVDNNERKILGKNGVISMEEVMQSNDSTVVITKTGEIKVGNKTVDSILVLNVNNAGELQRASGSNFTIDGKESFAVPETDYSISQGFLEGANTNPIIEMQAMIQLNKEYESTQKVIAALDKSLEHANEIGKV
ncbi:MAG: flagellar hook basal-body protein [Melioribacteraceae bacterium]